MAMAGSPSRFADEAEGTVLDDGIRVARSLSGAWAGPSSPHPPSPTADLSDMNITTPKGNALTMTPVDISNSHQDSRISDHSYPTFIKTLPHSGREKDSPSSTRTSDERVSEADTESACELTTTLVETMSPRSAPTSRLPLPISEHGLALDGSFTFPPLPNAPRLGVTDLPLLQRGTAQPFSLSHHATEHAQLPHPPPSNIAIGAQTVAPPDDLRPAESPLSATISLPEDGSAVHAREAFLSRPLGRVARRAALDPYPHHKPANLPPPNSVPLSAPLGRQHRVRSILQAHPTFSEDPPPLHRQGASTPPLDAEDVENIIAPSPRGRGMHKFSGVYDASSTAPSRAPSSVRSIMTPPPDDDLPLQRGGTEIFSISAPLLRDLTDAWEIDDERERAGTPSSHFSFESGTSDAVVPRFDYGGGSEPMSTHDMWSRPPLYESALGLYDCAAADSPASHMSFDSGSSEAVVSRSDFGDGSPMLTRDLWPSQLPTPVFQTGDLPPLNMDPSDMEDIEVDSTPTNAHDPAAHALLGGRM